MRLRIGFGPKLILSYFAVVTISFGAIAFFLDKRLEENSLRNIESSLTAQARLVDGQIAQAILRGGGPAEISRLVADMGRRASCRITLIDAAGKVLADSEEPAEKVTLMDNHIGRPEVRAALSGGVGTNIRRSPTLNIDMLYVAVPARGVREGAGVVRLALPLEMVEKTLWVVRRIILSGLLFAVVVAVAIGSILASRTIEPINRMIHVSRRFSEGDFARRIIQAPDDEIGQLAETLNRMAGDIEDKIKEVRSQNQRLEAVFNSMVEGVLVVDRSSRIVSANAAIEKMFGVPDKASEGRLLLDVIRNNDIASLVNAAIDKGEAVSAEAEIVYPVSRIIRVNATPLFDGAAVGGCLAVVHDMSETRRLETVRSDFVANVSHELKTPLTSIKGFVETLREGAIDDKENGPAFLKIIQDHTDRLDRLVDDLLALAHIESREMELRRGKFDLRKLADDIIPGFRSQMARKRVEVKDELPAGAIVNADRERVGQVLTNLIDNAIKFNRDGGSVRIYCADSDGAVKVTVEDSGCGIPAKELGRIFERFYRVDKARSRDLGGTGLGLSIVKHIVELHGGSVGVESSEGLGSKFWFTLPR
jgi:two-component system phosphate regulon sensor histidine kinase PhoR